MDPMNPFERKVVHDIVAAAGLISDSEGVGPNHGMSSSSLPTTMRLPKVAMLPK